MKPMTDEWLKELIQSNEMIDVLSRQDVADLAEEIVNLRLALGDACGILLKPVQVDYSAVVEQIRARAEGRK